MAIESLHDLELVVRRAQNLAVSLRDLQLRANKRITVPMPVPLTLSALEAWLQECEEALKRPRIAESKKLLTQAGIDPASIPASVLNEVEQIETIVGGLAPLPAEIQSRATTMVGHALTKGVPEAESVLRAISGLAASLGPVLELKASCPGPTAIVFRALPETIDGFPNYLKTALTIRSHLCHIMKMGVGIVVEAKTLVELENELSRFDRAYRVLHDLVSREGITDGDWLAVQGLTLPEATIACDARLNKIAREKETLRTRYTSVAERLLAMGSASSDAPENLAELRDAVSEIEKRLAARHKEMVKSLGEDTVVLVESMMNGSLPPTDALGDQRLGKAIRRAVNAGFQILIEAPHED